MVNTNESSVCFDYLPNYRTMKLLQRRVNLVRYNLRIAYVVCNFVRQVLPFFLELMILMYNGIVDTGPRKVKFTNEYNS